MVVLFMSILASQPLLTHTKLHTHPPQLCRSKLAISIALAVSSLAPFSVQAAPPLAESNIDITSDASMPSIRLDPIVVTATRSERALSDTPVALQLLSRQQLDDNHAHTLKEALTLLPNVYLREIHGKTGYEVSMQGFTGDQVLVLIDGLPIYRQHWLDGKFESIYEYGY